MAKCFVKLEVVLFGRRVGNGREVAKIKLAGIYDDPGDGVAMPANEFGGGMGDDVHTMINGAAEVGCGEGAVYDHGDAMAVCQFGQGF